MNFIKKHKILSGIFLVVILFALYVAYIAIGAYTKTSAIISELESSDKLSLKIENVPKDYLDALLAIEDPNFYSHSGVDLTTDGAGWTTITQGIVKRYFFENFKPGMLNKFNQSIMAIVFNSRVEKDKQLEIFFNSAYLGEFEGQKVIGFQDAAKTYFDKEFSELSKDEFLKLTAMLVAPNKFSVKKAPKKNEKRVRRIKNLLDGKCKPDGMSDVFYKNCD